MKRFLADAILILILVGLGGYVQKQDEKVPSIEAEVEAFEDTIAQHKGLLLKIRRYIYKIRKIIKQVAWRSMAVLLSLIRCMVEWKCFRLCLTPY